MDLAALPPCRVCALPSRGTTCSERCRGLRTLRRRVEESAAAVREALLKSLRAAPVDGGSEPGPLAFAVLRGLSVPVRDARDALAVARAEFYALRAAGRVRFVQRGRVVPPGRAFVAGPWRVAAR